MKRDVTLFDVFPADGSNAKPTIEKIYLSLRLCDNVNKSVLLLCYYLVKIERKTILVLDFIVFMGKKATNSDKISWCGQLIVITLLLTASYCGNISG